jgi:hypothetical protein
MKRRNLTRGASILFALTLITTSVIGGTFAKYVTSDTVEKTARVAKFGVDISADGELFSTTYKSIDSSKLNGSDLVINSSEEVVAPGAKNDTGVTISVTGEPEVAVAVEIKLDKSSTDINLPEGSYIDPTNILKDKNISIAKGDEYYPIKYTVKKGDSEVGTSGTLGSLTSNGSKDGVLYYAEFGPGTKLEDEVGTLNLTWAWTFEDSDLNDAKDTLLGNMAYEDSTKANLNTNVKFIVTVTQIDKYTVTNAQ